MLLSELSHPNQLHGLTVSQLEEIACQIREIHLEDPLFLEKLHC